MGITHWFRRNSSTDSFRPSPRDITFDTGGRREGVTSTVDTVAWQHSDGDRVNASVTRATPEQPLWPWRLDALRTFAREAAAARDGGLVSATFDRANGVPIARVISKFPEGSGYVYEGTVIIRFRDAQYGVTLHASEVGTTGVREAMTTGLLVQLGELQLPKVVPPATSASLDGWFDDPYDDSYAGPTLHSLSDDDRIDALLPHHPLSRVRLWLEEVQRTIAVAPDLRSYVIEPEPSSGLPDQTRHRMSPLAVGILWMNTSRPDVAERYLAEGVAMRNGEPILDAPRAGDLLGVLGSIREVLGRNDDAIWAHQWAVEAFKATTGESSPRTIRARASLGRVYAGLGRHADAEPLLAAAIPLFESGNNDSELAVALNSMGLVRQAQGQHADALPQFQRALALFEKLQGPDYAECATVLRNMARSLEATGDQVGSVKASRRAAQIQAK